MKPKIPKSKRMNLPTASVTAEDENKNGSSVENQSPLKLNGGDINTIKEDDTSRYIGVTYRTRRKKYQARMYRGSHEYNLGLFDLAADAALAYDAAHRIAGGRGSTASSAPPLKTSEGDETRVSRGSSMIADAEEIKYALDWIDCADEMERPPGLPEDDPMHLNFLHPSDFRQAREKEKMSRLKDKNSSSNNSDDDVVFPTESDLKLRMKQEILNIAKAYVAQNQQAKSVGPPDEGSDITDDEELNQPGEVNSNEGDARKKSNRPAKKQKLQHMSLSAEYEDCHEEAQTLLSLNKRNTKESKQKARAAKLLEFMTGGGEAAVDNKNGQVSKPAQSDGAKAKENPPGSDDRKQSSSDAENIQQQLQQNLTRQQALKIDSFHGSFNQRALVNSLLSQYSLEQVLRFARERPDLVNEETIQEFVRAQGTDMSQQLVHNDNQRDLLYTQLQAAMMTGGHFNPTQLPMGMQEMAAVAEPIQRRGNNASVGNAKQINRGGTGDGPSSSQSRQSSFMSDESPYLKVLEEYKKHGVGNQDQAAMQKKIANEAKRAALAQKLSVHLSSNEAGASTSTAERPKADEKKSSPEAPSVNDSTEGAAAAFSDKKGGDKEIKDTKTSPPSSLKDGAGGSDSSRVGDSPKSSASSKAKPTGQPNAIPHQTPQSVGSLPVAGLQQGFASLQAMDPFQQAILQHAMANANAPQQHHLAQSYGGGTASEIPGHTLRLQQQLISGEYRLQQLRQTLQTQALLPYLNMGGFGASLPNNMLNQLAASNAFAGAGLMQQSMNNNNQELLLQQSMNNNNQELLLQQALALQSNQNALMGGVLQSPVPNNEQVRMAAQRQGIDAGTLAQLLRGETFQPPSKKD